MWARYALIVNRMFCPELLTILNFFRKLFINLESGYKKTSHELPKELEYRVSTRWNGETGGDANIDDHTLSFDTPTEYEGNA